MAQSTQAAGSTYTCSNTDNGYRNSIITLDKSNAQVKVVDSDGNWTFAAEFRPDNTVFWIHNVQQGDVTGTVKFTLKLSEKILDTVMHAEADGQTQNSEMLWSCAGPTPP